MPANKSDVLLIPAFNAEELAGKRITVKWQQTLSQKSADYYTLVVKNKSQDDAEVVFFIAAEWYNDAHLATVASKDASGSFELKVDGMFQYGQKNAQGENRFIVYHDKGRKPYQHRFIESALASKAADFTTKIAGMFGYGSAADLIHNIASAFVGDYLHTF
ncbi:hypothetical protein OBBRIDRAFT_337233 [Obba rivulosa]|uniref:Uncharacterized protein n=1 Tax=Obba rivulosa TaxID=1052685 RepID=A0A8E2DP96_9APHY|nr:hypothetical protein OBBRIDRAFT_337233 [Obba rivulosa]